MSLLTEVVNLPFLAGLNNKAHAYALDPPGLSSAKNVEFDELGALRLRKPYASIGTSIFGGGTLSGVRKIAVVGDELLAFTADTLYSWSETLTKWVSKGTHLAVATTETTRFGNGNDQVFADRAQLSGVVAMTWTEVLASSVLSYVAVFDATTGATLLAPTSLGAGNVRPRVTAISTKFIISWITGAGALEGYTIDPAAPTYTTGAAAGMIADCTQYDIVKDPNAAQAVIVGRNAAGTAYRIGKVDENLAVTASAKARTCDVMVALACAPTDRVMVMRCVAFTGAGLPSNIKGDLIAVTTLADVTVNTQVGTSVGTDITIDHLTCAFRSVTTGGFYRCYAYWTIDGGERTESAYLDTNAAVGAQATVSQKLALASRAFDYNGSIYVWTVFATASSAAGSGVVTLGVRTQLQNTYFLYRDDVTLVSKATWSRAGGVGYHDGHLPNVALISGTTYAFAGQERQIVVIGGTDRTAYAARDPRDIVFTFDSDDARRVVQIGRTAYVSGGLLMQYDGERLVEVGFQQYPWYVALSVAGGVGAAGAGAYSYKGTFRRTNARGEVERSTTAIGAQITIVANDQVDVVVEGLYATRMPAVPAAEIWRTKVNPNVGFPFYLVTSNNPAATGDNGYLSASFTGTVTLAGDIFTDAILETKEQSPENGDALPRLAPPGASIICASDTRLFLAGIPGEPNRVWYSLLRSENEVAAFHGALSFALPTVTGAITALIVHDGTLYAFTASACYAVPGEGFDNVGGGSNYGPPRLVSSDVGALSHDTVTSTPSGVVFFSRKGWYRLRGLDVEYIGAKVEDYNTDTWVASQVVESQHQIRFLSSSRMLMFDYLVGEWSEWDQSGGKDLAMWRATPVLLDASAVKKQQTTFSAVDYYMEIVTGWIKPAGLAGFARLRRVLVLGEYKADHAQQVKIGFDYAPTYTNDAITEFFVASNAALVAGAPTQVRTGPRQQRLQSFRVSIKIVPAASGLVVPLTYDAVTLVGLALEVGIRQGPTPRIAAAYKQ